MTLLHVCLLIIGVVASHSLAAAASFDCTKAKTPLEKFICNDPALSDLDSQIGRVYQERRALLSPNGAEQLKRSQQSWLRFIDTVCTIGKALHAESRIEPNLCLWQEYHERLRQLGKVGQKLGPFIFNRIDLFSASKSRKGDDSGHYRGYRVQHVAYPQIDNIVSGTAQIWNDKSIVELPVTGECEDPGDYDIEYELGYATDKIISISRLDYTYCHKMAHGYWWSRTDNTVLLPVPHKLDASEVFRLDFNLVPRLEALFWEALRAQEWEPVDESARMQVLFHATSTENWRFTDAGLYVEFPPYLTGCYTCSPNPVTLPWADLKPLLAPNSVVP